MKKINDKGFTFVELLIYMGILSIFMIAVITLISSTVASNQKMNARKRLQTQATETYDAISDMLMGATDVKVSGQAYIQDTSAAVPTYNQVTGNFVVEPYDPANPNQYQKDATGKFVKTNNPTISYAVYFHIAEPNGTITPTHNRGLACYDIADVKPFTEATGGVPSSDPQTLIDVNYLYIKYASDLDASGNTIYTACTLEFDAAAHELLIYKYRSDVAGYNENAMKAYIENNSGVDDILCKNVANFQLQVNPETGTFAIILELEDGKTSVTYDMEGVVSLRNSFVLKRHAW